MNSKLISGIVGIVVGGFWLSKNYQYFEEQGFVAIGMPLIILVLGIVYCIRGIKDKK